MFVCVCVWRGGGGGRYVSDIIETQARAKLHYLPPSSPDVNPTEEVFITH